MIPQDKDKPYYAKGAEFYSSAMILLCSGKVSENKDDNIHKNEVQDIRLSDAYWINLTTNHYYELLWFRESFEVKYNIGFGIPVKFPSQRKKIFKSVHKQGNWTFVVSRLKEEKKYSNWSINK